MGKHEEKMNEKLTETLLYEVTSNSAEKAELHKPCDEETTECDHGELGYGAGDAVFSCFVVAPLVVGIWRGTWGIMDIHHIMFPYAQTYVMGIVIHICFTLLRSHLLERSTGAWSSVDGGAGRWLVERALSRLYTYIFILSNIMHWRGGWGLLDTVVVTILPNDDDPHRPVLIAAFTIFFYMSIATLRSAKNLLASPYFLVTDGKEATYIFTTRFKKTPHKEILSCEDVAILATLGRRVASTVDWLLVLLTLLPVESILKLGKNRNFLDVGKEWRYGDAITRKNGGRVRRVSSSSGGLARVPDVIPATTGQAVEVTPLTIMYYVLYVYLAVEIV